MPVQPFFVIGVASLFKSPLPSSFDSISHSLEIHDVKRINSYKICLSIHLFFYIFIIHLCLLSMFLSNYICFPFLIHLRFFYLSIYLYIYIYNIYLYIYIYIYIFVYMKVKCLIFLLVYQYNLYEPINSFNYQLTSLYPFLIYHLHSI